jgi:hypothetical protein
VISPQQRPHGAQVVAAGKLVAAIAAHQGDGQAGCGVGLGGQQAERCLVRPLQVVEEQHQRAAVRGAGQDRAHGGGEVDLVSKRLRNYEYNPVWGILVDQAWLR